MAVEPTETAWRIQASIADWTAKADSKASFALTMQSTALAVLGLLATSKRATGDLDSTLARLLLWVGVVLMVGGVSCAAWAISPNLRKQRRGPESNDDFLYFGHVRHLEPTTLEAALRNKDPLPTLSRQVVVMSEIAWNKHRRVQWSLMLGVSGCAAFGLATVVG
ncbi:Pycsar system effector family protein [Streptomyces armeniacus]|uniref:Pycsar system effector family protein n=1 Tax=Streptomyces armeniacus TaxID=83291 RepID=UPI001AD80925|nr:Pycsar system effector family protein [Streptomyces armeniacus]